MKALAPEKAQPLVKFHCSCVGDFGFQCDLPLEFNRAANKTKENKIGLLRHTSSASRSIIVSIAIRTSFVAIPFPRCSSFTASMAIYPLSKPPLCGSSFEITTPNRLSSLSNACKNLKSTYTVFQSIDWTMMLVDDRYLVLG